MAIFVGYFTFEDTVSYWGEVDGEFDYLVEAKDLAEALGKFKSGLQTTYRNRFKVTKEINLQELILVRELPANGLMLRITGHPTNHPGSFQEAMPDHDSPGAKLHQPDIGHEGNGDSGSGIPFDQFLVF